MELFQGQGLDLSQRQVLGQVAQQSLRMLAMPRQELRTAILREMALNPIVEDPPEADTASLDALVDSGEVAYDYDPPDMDAYGGFSAEDADRREYFFNSQTAKESLGEHLMRQIPLAGFTPREAGLAAALIANIDDDGYFRGSFPDLEMTTGASETRLKAVLARIRQFDPEGCGAANLAECYLAQLDKLKGTHLENETRAVVEHLDALAAGRTDEVCRAAGIEKSDLPDVLAVLKSLDPFPGRAFQPSRTAERIEVDVVLSRRADGQWRAAVKQRDLPQLRVKEKYIKALRRADNSPETLQYLQQKVAEVKEINDAIARRGETLKKIALAIAKLQEPWLLGETNGLKPVTIRAIAPEIGVHESTASRAVAGKWMKTPRGIVAMRDMFSSGIVGAAGEAISKHTVEERLKALVDAEDKSAPLSDERLAAMLKAEGFPVARRTVAKYRDQIGIPGTSKRRARG